jgi:hypothetical protein
MCLQQALVESYCLTQALSACLRLLTAWLRQLSRTAFQPKEQDYLPLCSPLQTLMFKPQKLGRAQRRL